MFDVLESILPGEEQRRRHYLISRKKDLENKYPFLHVNDISRKDIECCWLSASLPNGKNINIDPIDIGTNILDEIIRSMLAA